LAPLTWVTFMTVSDMLHLELNFWLSSCWKN
jgi:hypothetical protein